MTAPPDVHSLGFLVKLAARGLRDAAEILDRDPEAAEAVMPAEAVMLAEQGAMIKPCG
ncbi:hypothetical protein ACFV24_16455 [Nocardia fluminea]|uniref:hypothetical protein n=1 Tax=Nocardia fluminea TaxID=134984 RepID=UPI00366DFFF7